MILKAGTYTFKDTLEYAGFILNEDSIYFDFFLNNGDIPCHEMKIYVYEDDITLIYMPDFTHPYVYENGIWGEYIGVNTKTIYIEQDQTISTEYDEEDPEYAEEIKNAFMTTFISNTNYNEVNAKPLATIEYNGQTIAQLKAGETATLSCKDMKMVSDVVVKANEVESKIPEGYVKPEGTLNILQNNTTYDVSQYAEVRIATAHPYEVPLEMLMNNVISDASQATIGNVYKYTGETTDTYEQGALYILEEVSE